MCDEKLNAKKAEDTRHSIDIKISEDVKTELPDVGGAYVSVEHTRRIHGNPEDTTFSEHVSTIDLLNIAANLITSTILEGEASDESKLGVATCIAQEIMGRVISEVMPACVSMGEFDEMDLDALTEEQRASMELFLANPSLKYPVS